MKQNPQVHWCKCPAMITSKLSGLLFYLSGKFAANQIQNFHPFIQHIPNFSENFEDPVFVWIETNLDIASDNNLLILCQHWATFDNKMNPFYFVPRSEYLFLF